MPRWVSCASGRGCMRRGRGRGFFSSSTRPDCWHRNSATAAVSSALSRGSTSPRRQGGEHGVSFVGIDGDQAHWTYRQLYANARLGAGALRALGIEAGSRIVLRLADPCEFTLALWSCIVGGYVVVPTTDPGALPDDQ